MEIPLSQMVSRSTQNHSLCCSYACAWRRLSPSTDGQTGEAKDLWLFYFTDQPDIASKMTVELEGQSSPVQYMYIYTH